MPAEVVPEPCIRCAVLRQADYRPGTWLPSDLQSHFTLYHQLGEERLRQWQSSPTLTFRRGELILVCNSRLGRPGLMHAQPIEAGAYSFGGNWLWSDDPGFPSPQPIPIHDVPQP